MEKVLLDFFIDKKVGIGFPRSIENWVQNAANRARQLLLATHNGKYSHSSAKKEVSCIVLHKENIKDGYLRTGNCSTSNLSTVGGLDCLGNAAALDVYKFLSLILSDGMTVYHHIEKQSEYLRKNLGIDKNDYISICNKFLAIKTNEKGFQTSDLIKQVYFPIGDGYHLLSLLTPSCLVSEFKTRIDNNWRYSENIKEGRKARKNNQRHAGYEEFYNLTEMALGGTKPQNVGVLNNQNGGVVYLLASNPPIFNKRTIRLPKTDFFLNCLHKSDFEELFTALYRIFGMEYTNLAIRNARESIFKAIIDKIIFISLNIRATEGGWSERDYYKRLPLHQKIWLDTEKVKERFDVENWLSKIVDETTRWICAYTPDSSAKPIAPLGDDEFIYVRSLVEEIKEALL